MHGIQFYRPVREQPDFRKAPSLEAAQKEAEEWATKLDQDTIWKCGTTFGLTKRMAPCGSYIRLGDTKLIRCMEYIPARGCTGGDYYQTLEFNLECPSCGYVARHHGNKAPFPTKAFAEVVERKED